MVELLVGTTIALFVLAAGAALAVQQLHEARSVLAELQVMRELQRAVDLIARDLRRAGYNGRAGSARNLYAYVPDASTAGTPIEVRYSMDADENDRLDTNEQFGFRLRSGSIEMQLGGTWQSVTDPNVVTVTAFTVTPLAIDTPIAGVCPARLRTHRVALSVAATSSVDSRLARTLQQTSFVRTDVLSVASDCAS